MFDELFPYYLSIGMTYEQYWDGDPKLVIAYRKAEEIRTNRRNSELWLQGAYVYNAILSASPVLHAFAKKGTKPSPYMAEPFPIGKQQVEKKVESEEKKVFDQGKDMMEAFMTQFNKRFEGRKE